MYKGFVDFHNPPPNLFTPFAQEIVAAGIFIFFVCWGIAKIIKEVKK